MQGEGKAPPADAKAAADAKADAPADGSADAPADAPAGSDPMYEAAAKNLVKLMKPELEKQLAQVPEAQRGMVEQQMKSRLTVPALTQQCQQQKPSPKELECVVNAKTADELQACQPRPSGPPPRGPAPGGAAAPVRPPTLAGPAPGGTAPAPTGEAKAPIPKPPTPKPPADGKAPADAKADG